MAIKVLGGNGRFSIGEAPEKEPTVREPKAVDDVASGIAGQTITINPLANDEDPVGGGLTIVEPLSVSGSGSASITQGGTRISFTRGSEGTSTIGYTIEDADGQRSSASIVVNYAAAPDPGSRTVQIAAVDHQSSYPAPCPVYMEATLAGFEADIQALAPDSQVIGDPKRWDHVLLCVWHYGDPGSVFADHSGRLGKMPNWNNADVGYGVVGTKVYRQAGTYAPFMRVWYGAGPNDFVDSDPLSIDVADPAVVFTGKTLYVAADGDFSAAPSGADTLHTSSFAAAINAVSGQVRRLRMKRGNTFLCDRGSLPSISRMLIDAWGPGTGNWILDVSSAGFPMAGGSGMDYLGVQDCEVDGKWNVPSNSYDRPSHPSAGPSIGNDTSGNPNIIFDNLYSHNIRNNCFTASHGKTGDTRLKRITLLDCRMEEWGDAGLYGLFSFCAFLGTYVNSRSGKNQSLDGEGPGMRAERMGQRDTDQGWGVLCCSDVSEFYWGRKNSVQPSYKLQGNAELDALWRGDRMIWEGGLMTNTGVGSTLSQRQNGMIDKFVYIGNPDTGQPIVASNGGTHLRNGYIVYSPTKQAPKKGQTSISHVNGAPIKFPSNVQTTDGAAEENRTTYMYVSGCSALYWTVPGRQGAPNDFFGIAWGEIGSTGQPADNPGQWPDQRVCNNILVAPFYPNWPASDVDLSEGLGIVPNFLGRRIWDENGGALQTDYAVPAVFSHGAYSNQEVVVAMRPTGANLVADQGPGDILPLDYIDMTLRGSTPAKGAWPPAAA